MVHYLWIASVEFIKKGMVTSGRLTAMALSRLGAVVKPPSNASKSNCDHETEVHQEKNADRAANSIKTKSNEKELNQNGNQNFSEKLSFKKKSVWGMDGLSHWT